MTGRIAFAQVSNNTLRFVRRLESRGFPECKGNGVPNADWHPQCSNIWNERVVHVREHVTSCTAAINAFEHT